MLRRDRADFAVLPAHYAIDLDRLRALAGATALRLATPDEMKTLYRDCEEGAMPPFGDLYLQRVFVEQSLRARWLSVGHSMMSSGAPRNSRISAA